MSENQAVDQTAEQVAAAKAEAKAKVDAAKKEAKEKADVAKAEGKAKADAAKAEVKAKKDADAAAAKAAKDTAAAEKARLKAEAAAQAGTAKVKVAQPQNNGITRPRPEGLCGKVWAIADAMSAAIGGPVSISALQKETSAAGLNDATTRTQYARWKTFNNVFVPVPKPAVAPAQAAA